MQAYQLSDYDAGVLCDDKAQASYFEAVLEHTDTYKAVANWLLGPVKSYLNDTNSSFDAFTLNPGTLAALVDLVESGKLNFGNASAKLLPALLTNPDKLPLQLATELNLLQESDSGSIEQWVDEVITKMPDKVKDYRSGKKGLIGLFAGEVKKLSKGKADMQQVNAILQHKLNN